MTELNPALAPGALADRILMTGPGKSTEKLTELVSLDVRAVISESLPELRFIDSIAERVEGRWGDGSPPLVFHEFKRNQV